MNDGEYEFDRMLKSMENEVLALKTAHQRPLGTLNFFRKDLSFNVEIAAGDYSVGFYIDITIATPSVIPPIVQAGWNVPSGFFETTFEGMNTSGDYSVWTYALSLSNDNSAAQTINIKTMALSSQPIIGISWRYNP